MRIIIVINIKNRKVIYPHESLAAGGGDAGRELAHWGGGLGRGLKIVL